MNIISKILQRRGIKAEDLSKEEKVTVLNWQKILSGGEITLDKIKKFCEENINYIEAKFKDIYTSKEKLERLVLLHNVYSTLLRVITAPADEREALELYLSSLL